MYTARRKIHKDKDVEPTEFEESVAQSFFDLENTNLELKSDLKDLYISSAVPMDVAGNWSVVVIHVPYRLRKAFRKIHVRLVRKLEKKFSEKVTQLNSSYPGGLASYIQNARNLLADSKAGKNPFNGFTPSIRLSKLGGFRSLHQGRESSPPPVGPSLGKAQDEMVPSGTARF